MLHLNYPKIADTQVNGGFARDVQQMVREKVLPYQYRALRDENPGAEKSGAWENFRRAAAGETSGHYGFVFQDSDMAKWLEAAAYSLALCPDAQLEQRCDEAIDMIEKAQMPDGYLDTYYQLTDITKRWTNLCDHHELYCAGHMLEAAVAYAEATGKEKLLDVMRRVIRHIRTVIGPEEGKLHGYPGHEEIELALEHLYAYDGDKDALALARYFIDERGKEPLFFEQEELRRGKPSRRSVRSAFAYHYFQADKPVREQKKMRGHSVRAMYLLSGMLDVARETNDEELFEASRTLLKNTVEQRMYITGGVGSSDHGEAFTFDYDLPNDTVYAETCASIALIFACRRMLQCEPNGAWADVMERALYNTCMAGMALDGEHFFYVNPLEVNPEASEYDPGKFHVLPVRPRWYGCACCPPNLARLLLSLSSYQYVCGERDIYANLYLDGEATLRLAQGEKHLTMRTNYPSDGRVELTLEEGDYCVHLHLPDWCRSYSVSHPYEVQDGYVCVSGPFKAGETIVFDMQMQPERNWVDLRVRDNVGRVALSYGPVVYCLEQADNGAQLQNLILPRNAAIETHIDAALLGGTRVLMAQGKRLTQPPRALYTQENPTRMEEAELTFIPYYKWANRGENEMSVFAREI